MLCAGLALIVLFLSIAYGLSDSYHSPLWWFVLLDKTLLLFEAPVAVTLRLIYHPSARFDPPGFFAIDLVDGSNAFVTVGLCAMWSLAFAFVMVRAMRWCKSGKPN